MTADALANLDLEAFASELAGAPQASGCPIGRGRGTSAGCADGVAVFDAPSAVHVAQQGCRAVLILRSSRPEDLAGLMASAAIVTQRGGYTSHDAVIARSMGRPALVLDEGTVDVSGERLALGDGCEVRAGDHVTVDGTNGTVHRGRIDHQSSAGAQEPRAWLREALAAGPPLDVRVNAESAAGASIGLAEGAMGIGLFRVEHVFLGGRRDLLERALVSVPGPDRDEAVRDIGAVLRETLVETLEVMDGLPVAVRLFDPPRHEFLPDPLDLALALHEIPDGAERAAAHERLELARRLSEHNPATGMRGVRLAVTVPELAEQQLHAVVEAAALLKRRGLDPRPQVMLPMVMNVEEILWARSLLAEALAGHSGASLGGGMSLGAMVETPRAALLAPSLAAHVDFLSIGSNDLTALIWGLSREDSERDVLPAYERQGLLRASPFRKLDVSGVGAMVAHAVRAAKSAHPDVSVGVCGEHAGDPAAAQFFLRAGVDYLSCAVPSLLLARAAAAQVRVN